MTLIESTRNETVKRARQLATRKGRLEQGLHFIEGDRLVREAVISGAEIHEAFIEEGHELMAAVLEGAGIWYIDPIAARSGFGAYGSAQPLPSSSPTAPMASAVLSMVPRLPGSCTASSATISPSG